MNILFRVRMLISEKWHINLDSKKMQILTAITWRIVSFVNALFASIVLNERADNTVNRNSLSRLWSYVWKEVSWRRPRASHGEVGDGRSTCKLSSPVSTKRSTRASISLERLVDIIGNNRTSLPSTRPIFLPIHPLLASLIGPLISPERSHWWALRVVSIKRSISRARSDRFRARQACE